MRRILAYLAIGAMMVAVVFLASIIGSGEPMPSEMIEINGGGR